MLLIPDPTSGEAVAEGKIPVDALAARHAPAMLRLAAAYTATVLISIALFLLIAARGAGLVAQGFSGFGTGTPPEAVDTFAHVLLALLVVLAASRVAGALFRFLHQPAVIGEICVGILLGPSLLGQAAPGLSTYLFPASINTSLGLIAETGVVAFMFLVGLEFNPRLLSIGSHAAVAISHAGIVVPFVLGSGLALAIYPTFATQDVPFSVFAMFMGISMSVTAFPVLARILRERQFSTTRIGTIALTCAAVGDATAWCLLAVFVGFARARAADGLLTAYLTVGYVLLMVAIVRPQLTRFLRRYDDRELSQGGVAVVVAGLLLSTLATEAIGIHALFGAFLFGAIIPDDAMVARQIRNNLENVILVVLLPMFFAYTGLRTQIGLINGPGYLLVLASIIAVACAGKFGGSLIAARLTGVRWSEAAILATLMNTRGLMELIVLNLGLDLKILSPTLFAMLVVMAVVTTFLTTPVVDLLIPRSRLSMDAA